MLPHLRPIPIKDRMSILFIEYGNIDVIDGAFVVVDKTGVRTQIPVGSIACLMLEPGTRVSHAAAALASRVGTLLIWVGEGGGSRPRTAACGSRPSRARGLMAFSNLFFDSFNFVLYISKFSYLSPVK